MPQISNTAGGGSFSSFGSGLGMPGGLTNSPAQYLAALINRQAMYPYPRKPTGVGIGASAPAAPSAPATTPDTEKRDPIDVAMKQERYRQMVLEDQAKDAPAPTKMISGPQIVPGQVMDPLAMNSMQRDLYMPKSNQSEGPSVGDKAQAAVDERTGADQADEDSHVDQAKKLADLFATSGDIGGAKAMHAQDTSDDEDERRRLAMAQMGVNG